MRRAFFYALVPCALAIGIACTGSDPDPASGGSSSGTSGNATSSGGTSGGATSSGGTSGGATSSGDAAACSTMPFGAPQPLAFSSDASTLEIAPALTRDMNALVYVTDELTQGDGSFDTELDLAARIRTDAGFVAPPLDWMAAINEPKAFDSDPSLTPDGFHLFWLTGHFGTSDPAIRVASRLTANEAFGTRQPIAITPVVSSPKAPHYVGGPNKTLYFVAQTNDGASAATYVLHTATLTNDSFTSFDKAALVSSVVGPIVTQQFAIRENERELYYSKKVMAGADPQREIIGLLQRDEPGQLWHGSEEDLGVLDDHVSRHLATWVSPDGCTLYFSRGVPASAPTRWRMFVATRGQ